MKRPIKGLLVGALLATGLGHARVTYAHGTAIEVMQSAVAVKATFDDGAPMAEAQVLVYSPDDPATPWQTGKTDAEGTYLFAPAAEMPGDWEVTVRKAGHGGTTTFAVNSAGAAVSAVADSAAAPVQKWISMAAIVWGFVGTALFFARKAAPAVAPAEPLAASTSSSTRKAADPVTVSSSSGGQP